MRALIAACALVALVLPAPVPAQTAGSPAALLALHRQFVGWQFGAYATVVMQGTIEQNGAQAGTWTTREIGAAYRTQIADNPEFVASDSGFTGHVFWESDDNGFTRPNYSPYQAFAISRYVLLNEGTASLQATAQGSQSVGGVPCSVVRVTPPNGDAIDLYVDPSTGAYRRAVIDPGGPYQATYDDLAYGDFAGGKHYLSAYSVGDLKYAVTSFQTNVPVSTLQLHPPLPAATWSFGAPTSVPIVLTPFAWLVHATIDGVSGVFAIDTGLSDVLLSSDFASRLHLAASGSHEITGAGMGPRLRVQNAHVDTLAIGGNTLHDLNVLVGGRDTTINGTEFQSELPTVTVNGYIGFPLFAAAVVTIDSSGKTLTIADPATATVDQNGYPAPVDLSTGEPRVQMNINGGAPVVTTLDSSNGSFIALSQEALDVHHVPMMASEGTMSTVGQMNYGVNSNFDPNAGVSVGNYLQAHPVVQSLGGKEVQRCSNGSSVTLGPIHDQGVTLCVSPSLTGDRMVAGFAFMQYFNWVFDYPQGVLVIRPHSP